VGADGLVDETAMLEAPGRLAEQRIHVVTYLTARNLADPREIAIAPRTSSAAPLLDLDFPSPRFRHDQAGQREDAAPAPVLPLVEAGQALFRGRFRPYQPAMPLDEVKFATGLFRRGVSSSRGTSSTACSASRSRQGGHGDAELAGDDFELDSLEVSSEDETADEELMRADVEDPDRPFVHKV